MIWKKNEDNLMTAIKVRLILLIDTCNRFDKITSCLFGKHKHGIWSNIKGNAVLTLIQNSNCFPGCQPIVIPQMLFVCFFFSSGFTQHNTCNVLCDATSQKKKKCKFQELRERLWTDGDCCSNYAIHVLNSSFVFL